MGYLLQLPNKKINREKERNITYVKIKYVDILGSATTFWGTSPTEKCPEKISS